MGPVWPPGHRDDPGLIPVLTRRRRAGLLLIACRWWEVILALAVTAGALAGVDSSLGTRAAVALLAVAGAAAVVVAVLPGSRQWAMSLAWCLITPHRVRTCFAQRWVLNAAGKTPAVLWTRRTPAGERVRVWCGAGLSFEDVAAVTAPLVAACYATDVVVARSERSAQLVYIDVIRRAGWSADAMAGPPAEDTGRDSRRWPGPGPDDQEIGPD